MMNINTSNELTKHSWAREITYSTRIFHDIVNVTAGVDLTGRISALLGELRESSNIEWETLRVDDVPMELAHLFIEL